MGAFIGGGGVALLLVFDLFWRFPWQVMLLLVAGLVVLGGLIAAMSLADVRRETDRRESSRVSLLAWAVLNGGRCETDLAAFTTDGGGWELPASPLFCGTLLAVGHRDGVEVGIACSTDWDLEGERIGAWRSWSVSSRSGRLHGCAAGRYTDWACRRAWCRWRWAAGSCACGTRAGRMILWR